MRKILQDGEHVGRVVVLFILGLVAFLILRRVVVPAEFGTYGHYRDRAPAEARLRPVNFAGHTTCEMCHPDILQTKSTGKHAGVSCEACHGPLARHADDPAALKPTLPDTAVLCVRCHEANSAKPKSFPQVDSKEHSSGMPCNSCHKPHSPKI